MKTLDYNPSLLEVGFVKKLSSLKYELNSGLSTNNVQKITTKPGENEIVIKVIQLPDRL